jgi:signal transduction histidine kinase
MSVRARLTLWYFTILALTLTVFAAGIFAALRASVHVAVDENLKGRLNALQKFVERRGAMDDLEDMRDEFREHSGLGGDLLQVSDNEGNRAFRSLSIRDYDLAAQRQNIGTPRYETVFLKRGPLRVVSAQIALAGKNYNVQLAAPVTEAYDILGRFQWVLLASIPVVLLLASGSGYWMSRRALAPVDAVTTTARSISEHSLSKRLAVVETGDELQRLSQTFNQMMDRLESAFKRMTQFTADASHELRTPTTLIRAASEISLKQERSPAEYRDALAQILEEAQRMGILIDSLMTLARMDSGAESLKFTAVDVASIIREAGASSESPVARVRCRPGAIDCALDHRRSPCLNSR